MCICNIQTAVNDDKMFYCSYNNKQGRNGPITVVVRVKKCHFICIIPLQRFYKMLNITEQYILQNNSKIFLIDLSQMFWQMSKIKEQQHISCIYFLKALFLLFPLKNWSYFVCFAYLLDPNRILHQTDSCRSVFKIFFIN